MSLVDQEVDHYNEMQQVVQAQINEVNQQINTLNEKQKNFTNAANYLETVKVELTTLAGEVNNAIEVHNLKVIEFNKSREEILQFQKMVNDQITNKDMQLQFH